jgi:hypothetical protein
MVAEKCKSLHSRGPRWQIHKFRAVAYILRLLACDGSGHVACSINKQGKKDIERKTARLVTSSFIRQPHDTFSNLVVRVIVHFHFHTFHIFVHFSVSETVRTDKSFGPFAHCNIVRFCTEL